MSIVDEERKMDGKGYFSQPKRDLACGREVMMGRAGIRYECNFPLPPNRENLISFIHHALYYLEYSLAHLTGRVSCF